MLSWIFLAASVVAYGVANFLQAVAATRLSGSPSLTPQLFFRLANYKSYVVGLLCQLIAAVLAFFARRDLPLFLVQASVAAGLGVTAILGVALLKWRLPGTEVALLLALAGGLAALIVSAERSHSRELGPLFLLVLGGLVVAFGFAGHLATSISGPPGSVLLGSLAGAAFGAAAIASRPLASADSWSDFATNPLLYVMLAHMAMGQLLFGLALQRGTTTAVVAAMDAATAIPAALVGLLLLGDQIKPGLEWLAVLGFVVTIGAVVGLARYAKPQRHDVDEGLEQLGLRKVASSA